MRKHTQQVVNSGDVNQIRFNNTSQSIKETVLRKKPIIQEQVKTSQTR